MLFMSVLGNVDRTSQVAKLLKPACPTLPCAPSAYVNPRRGQRDLLRACSRARGKLGSSVAFVGAECGLLQ
jgi:hypothetical protein